MAPSVLLVLAPPNSPNLHSSVLSGRHRSIPCSSIGRPHCPPSILTPTPPTSSTSSQEARAVSRGSEGSFDIVDASLSEKATWPLISVANTACAFLFFTRDAPILPSPFGIFQVEGTISMEYIYKQSFLTLFLHFLIAKLPHSTQ